jgi:hypothetical protein
LWKRCCDLELITVVKLCWMHVCESTSKNVALSERLLS